MPDSARDLIVSMQVCVPSDKNNSYRNSSPKPNATEERQIEDYRCRRGCI